ncbi:DUF742 domain-containing protein [Microtetraspora niveoalba]|uniref:DUF742 domain-containing protein n=1 Tax=Microtetraspora niveoalba TaxID=46175 RepID=UPI000A008583|nr:DUF742 domain-containing protein [Microtetraspora niveoalba]
MTEQEYGPLLRPYTITRGRTRPTGPEFDLMTIIRTAPSAPDRAAGLSPEHLRILAVCQSPTTLVDLASETGFSVNVLRILLGDLRDRGVITARPPAAVGHLPEERILLEVIQGLQAL